jgi:hypothetical protein
VAAVERLRPPDPRRDVDGRDAAAPRDRGVSQLLEATPGANVCGGRGDSRGLGRPGLCLLHLLFRLPSQR